jgi:hypothetical protein
MGWSGGIGSKQKERIGGCKRVKGRKKGKGKREERKKERKKERKV